MIDWDIKIIPHFTLREARCRCNCGLVILQSDLLLKLESLRERWAAPILVKSWTRCIPWNKHEGGKKDSYHINGHAIDIRPLYTPDLRYFHEYCLAYFQFTKQYDTFIHCDIREERPVI